MVEIKIDDSQLLELTRTLSGFPGLFTRARRSAIKSAAWMVRQELRNHVEYGGTGWAKLHPLTLKFRKKYGQRSKWSKRSSHPGPLFWMGKFARYNAADNGDTFAIMFGKSRAARSGSRSYRPGESGTADAGLMAATARAEMGATVPVTDKMRRMMAATRGKRNQQSGQTYFPLKKETRALKIPARPIFTPVWNKVNQKIGPWFDKKFTAAVNRYLTGAAKV